MQKNIIIATVVVLVVGGGWYLFRPERLWVNQTVSEKLPSGPAGSPMNEAAPVAIASGSFHGVAHKTMGTATLYREPDGRRVLRLTGFETSNGPDVQDYLVAAPDAGDNATVTTAGFVSLGALKGNIGDQNYAVPGELDLGKYRAVTIWCRRFGVNFATAPLSPPQS